MTNYNILEGAVLRQAVQLSPLRCVLHIRQTSSFFSGGRLETPVTPRGQPW